MSSRAGIHAPCYSCLVLEDGLAREPNPVTCEGAVARVKFGWVQQFEFLDEGAARVGMEFGQLVKKDSVSDEFLFREKGTCDSRSLFRSWKL